MTTWNNDSAQDIISDIKNACEMIQQRALNPSPDFLVLAAPDKDYENKLEVMAKNPSGNTKLQKFFNRIKARAALRRARNTNKVREFFIEWGNQTVTKCLITGGNKYYDPKI